jgi:hypothetical protein
MSHEAIGKSDEWFTPKYIFDALQVKFDCDVCCPQDLTHIKTPCHEYICANSLEYIWKGFVWMNPPFGGRNGLYPWLDKIADHGNGIALTPDRTSAPWWQYIVNRSDAHLQVKGKIKFIDGNGNEGKQPGNGTTLFAFGNKAVAALMNARDNKLGTLFMQIKVNQHRRP